MMEQRLNAHHGRSWHSVIQILAFTMCHSLLISRTGPSWGYFGPSSALPGATGPSGSNYEAHGHVNQGDARKFLNPTITWIALLYT